VVQGALRLEFGDGKRDPITLEAGDSFVIPAQTPFRGYRWPRESETPCLFIAVSPADVGESKASFG
jgi:mannose-6-phosphate isomerase-like protein (cupin superfamily)